MEIILQYLVRSYLPLYGVVYNVKLAQFLEEANVCEG